MLRRVCLATCLDLAEKADSKQGGMGRCRLWVKWRRLAENTMLPCPVSPDSAKCPSALRPNIYIYSLSHFAQDKKEGGGRAGHSFFVPVPKVLALESKGRCRAQLPNLGASPKVSLDFVQLPYQAADPTPPYPGPKGERSVQRSWRLITTQSQFMSHGSPRGSRHAAPGPGRAADPRSGRTHARGLSLLSGPVGVAGTVGVSNTKAWTFVSRPGDWTLLPLSKPIEGLSLGETAPRHLTSPEVRSPLRHAGRARVVPSPSSPSLQGAGVGCVVGMVEKRTLEEEQVFTTSATQCPCATAHRSMAPVFQESESLGWSWPAGAPGLSPLLRGFPCSQEIFFLSFTPYIRMRFLPPPTKSPFFFRSQQRSGDLGE